MTEHDARDAQTLEDRANKVVDDFLDETANYKPYWPNILVKLVFTALREAADAAHAAGKAEGAAEERERLLEPLGYDKNGEGLTSEDVWEDELVTICHNPYYDLEGVLIDLERQDADKVCLDTIRRIQMRLADVARRAREGGDSDG